MNKKFLPSRKSTIKIPGLEKIDKNNLESINKPNPNISVKLEFEINGNNKLETKNQNNLENGSNKLEQKNKNNNLENDDDIEILPPKPQVKHYVDLSKEENDLKLEKTHAVLIDGQKYIDIKWFKGSSSNLTEEKLKEYGGLDASISIFSKPPDIKNLEKIEDVEMQKEEIEKLLLKYEYLNKTICYHQKLWRSKLDYLRLKKKEREKLDEINEKYETDIKSLEKKKKNY